jgi:uncharacterized protein (DUF1697 family)
MTTHIALLRGVNVSGANRLPMAEFRDMLGGAGLTNVRSYIASGNAVFDSALDAETLARLIGNAIKTRFGFASDVFILTPADLFAAQHDHPFAAADPARVHVFFLKTAITSVDDAALQALSAAGDGWHISANRFHLHTPAGLGTSKLAEKLPRFLPAPMTARNLRTIAALVGMTQPPFPS